MIIPKPIRWLVHNYRCRQWLKLRERHGINTLSFARAYARSQHWYETGTYPTEEQIDEIETARWTEIVKEVFRL